MTYKPVLAGEGRALDRRHRSPDAPPTALCRSRLDTLNTGVRCIEAKAALPGGGDRMSHLPWPVPVEILHRRGDAGR